MPQYKKNDYYILLNNFAGNQYIGITKLIISLKFKKNVNFHKYLYNNYYALKYYFC